tara:strand:- start:2789 stop:3502 length:714 start_codon:yes stop_codon:yes gene_type:complete
MAGTLKYIGQERFDSKVTVTDGGAEITGSIDVDGIIKERLNSLIPTILEGLVVHSDSYNVLGSNALTTQDGEAIIFDVDSSEHSMFPVSGSSLKITGDATIDGNLSATLILNDTVPTSDDAYDLGSSTKEWKDLYVDGTANIDSLAVTDAFTYGSTTWNETSGVNELTGSSWSFKATSGSGDLFSITNTDDDIVFRVQDSVVIMAARDTTPTAVSGGLFYSGSDQWFLGYKTFGSAS